MITVIEVLNPSKYSTGYGNSDTLIVDDIKDVAVRFYLIEDGSIYSGQSKVPLSLA